MRFDHPTYIAHTPTQREVTRPCPDTYIKAAAASVFTRRIRLLSASSRAAVVERFFSSLRSVSSSQTCWKMRSLSLAEPYRHSHTQRPSGTTLYHMLRPIGGLAGDVPEEATALPWENPSTALCPGSASCTERSPPARQKETWICWCSARYRKPSSHIPFPNQTRPPVDDSTRWCPAVDVWTCRCDGVQHAGETTASENVRRRARTLHAIVILTGRLGRGMTRWPSLRVELLGIITGCRISSSLRRSTAEPHQLQVLRMSPKFFPQCRPLLPRTLRHFVPATPDSA